MANLANLLSQLQDVRAGQDIREVSSATRTNAVHAILRSLARGENLVSGPGISKSSSSNAVILRATGDGANGSTVDLPFKIADTSTTSSGTITPKVTVTTGTVMDITPTNVATSLTLTTNAANTIYLLVTIDDDGLVTAASVEHATTGKPGDTTHYAYLLIGTALVDTDGVISLVEQSLYFSQGFKACDRDVADPATTPGTYQFFVR